MAKYTTFIHSTGMSPAMWDQVPAEIVGETGVWKPTNLGYPPLPTLQRGQVVTAEDDAAHLLKNLPQDATSLRIYAHSYGGLVALKLLQKLPIPVEHLTLIEPVLFGALNHDLAQFPQAETEVNYFAQHPWFVHDEIRGGTAEWLEVFIDYWNRPGSWARMPAEMQAQQILVGWKMYQEVRSCFLDPVPFDAWQLNVPLTLVVGERTTASAQAMVQGLAQVNPQARVLTVPGVGHMGVAMKPGVVWAAIAGK